MQGLIKIQQIQIGQEEEPGCDARELHGRLQVGRDFSTWIKQRIEEAMLKEGKDYFRSPNLGSEHRIDYHLTLDSAKHIAMLERSEIGYQIRQYFIDFEKKTRKALEEIAAKIQAQPDMVKVDRTHAAVYRLAMREGKVKVEARRKAREAVQREHGVDVYALLGIEEEAPENAGLLERNDREAKAFRRLLRAWRNRFGNEPITIKVVLEIAAREGGELKEAVQGLPGKGSLARKIGNFFKQLRQETKVVERSKKTNLGRIWSVNWPEN